MTDYLWNGSNGNFDTAGDWSPAGVPADGSDGASIRSGTVLFTGSSLSIGDLYLGLASLAGTLNVAGSANGDALLNNVFIEAGSLGNAIDVTGELDATGGYSRIYVPSQTSLAVTLTPGGADGLGILALENGAMLIADNYAQSTNAGGMVSISPDKAADITNVAFVNDGSASLYYSGSMFIDVPVYAQQGQTGTLSDTGGALEFGASVAGQTVTLGDNATLILDQPATFAAVLAPIEQDSLYPGPYGYYDYGAPPTLTSGISIDLRGVMADSLAFVTTPQGAGDIELLSGGAVIDTLFMQQGVTGALGISLSPDSVGGTTLKIDLSSASTDVTYGNGDAVLDPNALVLQATHTDYAISQGSSAFTITSASLTDYANPQATFVFADGLELFNANTNAAAIDRLYEGILGRDADGGGALYWSNLVAREGANFSQIASGILSSPEFGSKAVVSDTGFVDQLYADVLGRPADASGQSYWTGLLNEGLTRGQVAAAFTNSYEADTTDAARLAHGVFLGN